LSVVIVEPQGDGEDGAPRFQVAAGEAGFLVDGALVRSSINWRRSWGQASSSSTFIVYT